MDEKTSFFVLKSIILIIYSEARNVKVILEEKLQQKMNSSDKYIKFIFDQTEVCNRTFQSNQTEVLNGGSPGVKLTVPLINHLKNKIKNNIKILKIK